MGNLIPAGTGLTRYRKVKVYSPTGEPESEEYNNEDKATVKEEITEA